MSSNLTDSTYVHDNEESERDYECASPTSFVCSFSSLKDDSPQSDLYSQFSTAVIPYTESPMTENPLIQKRFSVAKETDTRLLMVPSSNDRNSLSRTPKNFTISFPERREENKQEESEREESCDEPLTEELITNINARISHHGDKELVLKYIKRMRRLGGLEPLKKNEKVDIPSARMGLAILSETNDTENKLLAFDSLLALLKKDKYHRSTAPKLINLALKLLEQMDRFLMQAETLPVQIKIAEVYDALTEAVHNHYGKRHLNLITLESSRALINAPKSLGRLNGLDDTKIKYYTECALEGVRRIGNDKQELFILAERIYHAIATAASVYFDSGDPEAHFRMVFKDLDPRLKSTWYNAILVLKNLSKDADTDINKLTALQLLLGSRSHELNWKFTYAGVNALFDIALNGATEQIRLRAFQGIKQTGSDIPGISFFINSKNLPSYKDGNAIKHLKIPKTKDPNYRIRELCAERLFELASNAPDELIRTKAQQAIRRRTKEEDHPIVKNILTKGFRSEASLTDLD